MNATVPAQEVALWRLYLLRAMYLLIVAGLAIFILPGVVQDAHPEASRGIVDCMLLAFWLLCLVGVRYPLRMLPVLFWELAWKSLWLALVALPQWRSGHLDAVTRANVAACAFAVLIPFVMPWRYVFDHYVRKPGDPWTPSA